MQIAEKYNKSYYFGLSKFRKERKIFNELSLIKNLRPLNSQANYIMCEVLKGSSLDLSITLLNKYNLIIKDLSTKLGVKNKNFIRLAVRDTEDNNKLLNALKTELGPKV